MGADIELAYSEKVVMNFGGSCLATPARTMYVCKLVKRHVDDGYWPVVVCSAMGKTTNALHSAGDSAIRGSISMEALRTLHTNALDSLVAPDATAITSKSGIRLIDIVSTKMLGQVGFLAKVFAVFEKYQVSVGVVAMSLTLDRTALDRYDVDAGCFLATSVFSNLIYFLYRICFRWTGLYGRATAGTQGLLGSAAVPGQGHHLANIQHRPRGRGAGHRLSGQGEGVKVEMLSQGASKVNVSLVARSADRDRFIRALHAAFFEGDTPTPHRRRRRQQQHTRLGGVGRCG